MATSKGILAPVLAAVLLTACGGGDDSAAREAQMEEMAQKYGVNADVSLDDSGEVTSVTINNANGAQLGKNLELPADFPADVPVAPDWAIMAISPAPGGFMVQAVTDAAVEDALALARTQLTSHGWTETGAAQTSPVMQQVGFSKGDRITNINLMDTGEMRTVQLVTMQPPR